MCQNEHQQFFDWIMTVPAALITDVFFIGFLRDAGTIAASKWKSLLDEAVSCVIWWGW